MTDRDTYHLILRAEPAQAGEPPVDVRLRQALKLLLRAFRLRCVEVTQQPAAAPPVTNAAPEKATPPAPPAWVESYPNVDPHKPLLERGERR